jgi:pyruvate, water dikinase
MTAVWLTDVNDDAAHGGKAAQLGAALRAGLPVPPGFALAHEHVDEIAACAADSPPSHIVEAFASLGGPVAVRSSAVGEDGAGASFAGQHATVLGVSCARTLLAAIRKVRDSAHAPSALAYRKRLGLQGTPRMGVVVQRLIDADKAGVLFTKNPLTGDEERVIEAAWGLGEIVVAGLVTPDRYRIARDGRVLERVAGEKDLAIRLREDGGTHETPVPEHQIAALCLDDAELGALHDLALRCEAHSAGPQDLEFAFAGGRLYLLQRRAITRAA